MRNQIDAVDRHGRIDPEKGLLEAVLLHLFAHKFRDVLLIDPVDCPAFVEKRQNGWEPVYGDIVFHLLPRLLPRGHKRLCRFVAQRGNDRRRGVKI